jgi:EGF-like domain
MKQFKLVLSTAILFILVATGVVFNACVKDPCADITCKNNGVCRDGRCKCPQGFEGPYCAEKTYEKFIGTWQGTYRCNGAVPDDRLAIIAPGDKPYTVSLYNLFTQNESLNVILDGDKMTIEEQTVNNVVYKGAGYVEGIYITLFIEEKDNATGVYSSCVLNATKFVQP